ncbi:MAG: hypothetical protein FIA93_01300 [Deltaproteobacteria bacterium]|nr:hypothetical protein [Deltaproteobacteria bacterium]
MKKLFIIFSFLMLSLLFLGPSYACYVEGRIYCDVNNNGIIDSNDIPMPNVKVSTYLNNLPYSEDFTDSNGHYYITVGVPYTWTLKIGPEGLPADAQIVKPASYPYSFETTNDTVKIEVDFLISSSTCQQAGGACWLTAGGVKFDSVLGFKAGESGPRFSFGGNTFPGCSPTAGDGGQWNFVDHGLKIHFQGWQVDEVKCGNVAGIPPGSTSPVTPFNFIEFSGWGTIKGIAGNKGPFADQYYFFVRAEDRNEPGNEKALLPGGGALVDRLFLRVYTNPSDPVGSIVYLLDMDGNPATVDPITITGGNLQIHISSCP